MIKKFLPDVSGLIFIAVVAFLVASKPGINLTVKAKAVPQQIKNTSVPVAVPPKNIAVSSSSSPQEALLERNIFAESGSYAIDAKAKPVLPEIPYQLIAILNGKENKAVFREYTGAIINMTTGKKMIDDYVIITINNTSVELQRGKEKKGLQLFNAAVSHQPAKAMEQHKNKTLSPVIYTLIGILGGQEKKAVLRSANGVVSIMPVGGMLGDGSVISVITPLSVKLKQGKKETELKMFDATRTMGR
ncbi:MAG: hypothetical protein CSYNP_00053 [Syntrophus sp. SKADARSKE-3]|nr:hypothetical protein [Syntrophus sp. SKADARSKE-3]